MEYLRGGASQAKGSKILTPFQTLLRHVGTILRSWALLGASWALLGLSCAFLDRLLAFLADFCMPWGAPGMILEGLGNVFGPSGAYIFKVLGAYAHAYRTSSGYAKT